VGVKEHAQGIIQRTTIIERKKEGEESLPPRPESTAIEAKGGGERGKGRHKRD